MKNIKRIVKSFSYRKAYFTFLSTFTVLFFLSASCEKNDIFTNHPERFLKTTELPSYFTMIPFYGENGKNWLVNSKVGKTVHLMGSYVKSKTSSYIRFFTNDGLYYVKLNDSLPYKSESTVVKLSGKIKIDNEPYLDDIQVESTIDLSKVINIVKAEYPDLIKKIWQRVHHPKSKLNPGTIKTWHLAVSGDTILVFSRTYDLMYEFDIGVLVKRQKNSFSLENIYAREFFKGE